ncbi:hypothetical protein I0O09_001581, partial [Campylobacter jejuni]|nr:hypothetical protein [Campylobacter jejuni]
VMGMIDFNFLKSIQLKFLDGIIHEDNLFGALLFFQLNNIYILPNKMYIYRMRPNSIMNHDKKNTKSDIAQYVLDLYDGINCDIKEIKSYLKTYSCSMIAIKLIEFLNRTNVDCSQKLFINQMLHHIYSVNLYDESLLKDFKVIAKNRKIVYEHLIRNNQILLGAVDHIKNQLCYKLGNQIVKSTSMVSMFLLPYKLLLITINHKIEKKILKIMSKKDPKYKPSSLNSYADYLIALKVKNHLSYKLGEALIKASKTWYKGGIIKLPFSMYRIYRDYKRKRLENAYSFDEEYFLREHLRIFKYKPNFRNPQTFNEKIIHRILYDHNPLYTALADKIKSRIFIKMMLDSKNYNSDILFSKIDNLSSIILETNNCRYLPKIYAVYKNIDEIDFSILPNSFVLKTNHDWNGVVVVENKKIFLQDIERKQKALAKLKCHLEQNFYYVSRERHYKDIEPRIFAEEYIKDEAGLKDFRFHVFNHNVEFIQVANSTHTSNNLYYPNWEILPIVYHNKRDICEVKKPQQLKEALCIAKILSLNFDYIRVDMYLVDSKIYIGELTFTPNCGKAKIEPAEWDLKLGQMWRSDVFKL